MSVNEDLARDTELLLACAVTRDHEQTAEIVQRIAERDKAQGVYGLCCVLAQMVTTFGLNTERGQGTAGVQITDSEGRLVEPDQLPAEYRSRLWATRFVAAYTNGDGGTTVALFEASLADPEGHVAGVCELIKLAGDVLRAAVAEAGGGAS